MYEIQDKRRPAFSLLTFEKKILKKWNIMDTNRDIFMDY